MNATTTSPVVSELVAAWKAINKELVAAPAWKIDTPWFMDREREMRHLETRLAALGVTTW